MILAEVAKAETVQVMPVGGVAKRAEIRVVRGYDAHRAAGGVGREGDPSGRADPLDGGRGKGECVSLRKLAELTVEAGDVCTLSEEMTPNVSLAVNVAILHIKGWINQQIEEYDHVVSRKPAGAFF